MMLIDAERSSTRTESLGVKAEGQSLEDISAPLANAS
jgi:hypothetical protein